MPFTPKDGLTFVASDSSPEARWAKQDKGRRTGIETRQRVCTRSTILKTGASRCYGRRHNIRSRFSEPFVIGSGPRKRRVT